MPGPQTPIISASSRTINPSMRPSSVRKREEQQQRLLQVALEIGGPAAAFGQQAERHAHQGVECRLNGAEINGTAREEKQS